MTLYILNDVLYDYTTGEGLSVVLAAESMEQCKELFMERFCYCGASDSVKRACEEDFNTAYVKVVEGVDHVAGVVSYVYGRGE